MKKAAETAAVIRKPEDVSGLFEVFFLELDLERGGDRADDIRVEIVCDFGSATVHRSRATTRHDADDTGQTQLYIFGRGVGNAGADSPGIGLVAVAVAGAAVPGQADRTAPLIVELVTDAAGHGRDAQIRPSGRRSGNEIRLPTPSGNGV